MVVKVTLKDGAQVPLRGSAKAAGYDLRSTVDATVMPHSIVLIPTGLNVQLPPNTQLEIRSRSGLAKRGIYVANGVGTIDEDYSGPLGVLLGNSSDQTFTVTVGDRIAQAVLMPYIPIEWEVVDSLDETERGSGGFGSSGLK